MCYRKKPISIKWGTKLSSMFSHQWFEARCYIGSPTVIHMMYVDELCKCFLIRIVVKYMLES